MADAAGIRAAYERNVRILKEKPQKGHITAVTTARMEHGLRCVIEEGAWRLNADMPNQVGGDGSAPTPGVLGRGALASCIAICVQSWAANMDIALDAVEVEVQADFDARGELGIGDVPTGYSEVRYRVSIESPAPRDAVDALLDTVERYSPYVAVFARPQPMKRAAYLNGEAL